MGQRSGVGHGFDCQHQLKRRLCRLPPPATAATGFPVTSAKVSNKWLRLTICSKSDNPLRPRVSVCRLRKQPAVLPEDSRALQGAHLGCPTWPPHPAAWAVGWAGARMC